MGEAQFKPEQEMAAVSIGAPAIESFLDSSKGGNVWPEEIVQNETFQLQIAAHMELNEDLKSVIDRFPSPTMTVESALGEGHVTEPQIEKLYLSLAEFISNNDYRRIVLYLPFELLPPADLVLNSEGLREAVHEFKSAYLDAWYELLSVHDVRANFVDGDVIEVEHRVGDLPRVVKAAHLIPMLVKRGMLKTSDVMALLEESIPPVLRESIFDAVPVLVDMGYFGEKEIELLNWSRESRNHDLADLVTQKLANNAVPLEEVFPPGLVTQAWIQQQLDEAIAKIDSEVNEGITEARKAWLKQREINRVVENLADDLCAAVSQDKLSKEQVAEFVQPEASDFCRIVLIEAIRKAIETHAPEDGDRAGALYDRFYKILLDLWEIGAPNIKDALAKALRRLFRLGVVDEEQLISLGIQMPNLEGSLTENLSRLPADLKGIRNAVEAIREDPDLSPLVYPICLAYGSLLKGYGENQSDLDLAVFIRPGVSISEMPRIKELLSKVLPKGQGKPIQFWLEKKGDKLAVHDSTHNGEPLGDSYWTHVLFGAVWIGNDEAIKELHERLLTQYFYDSGEIVHGRPARGVYLEEMERDALQYRLLHKGYERLFPSSGGINTPHAQSIDGESMFWDSGYRQLASKIFVSRVFLPKV